MGTKLVNRENRTDAAGVRSATNRARLVRLWWLGPAGVVLVFYLTKAYCGGHISFLELLLLATFSGICLWPGARWVLNGMPNLPLGEGFAFAHIIYYVIPCLGVTEGMENFSLEMQSQAIAAMIFYMGTFVAVYEWLVLRRYRPISRHNPLRREIKTSIIWLIFLVWVFLLLLRVYGVWSVGGNMRNIYNALLGGVGTISMACLFYQLGRGRLGGWATVLLVSGMVMGVSTFIITGTLIIGACMLGAAILTYALGLKRIPWIATLSVLLILGFLQQGKTAYRNALGSDQEGYVNNPTTFTGAYNLWFHLSWQAIMGGASDTQTQNIFQRTSLVQILALAMQTTPKNAPHLYGTTYAMIPELLIPRFVWPEKMHGTYPSEFLGIYLGIQTEEGADHTGIAIGAPAEAWLNFGWLGMVLAGAFMGFFYGLPASLTQRLEPIQIGWLSCCVLLSSCVDLEHSIPEKLCSMIDAFIMGFLILLPLSRVPKLIPRFKRAGAMRSGIASEILK